MLDIISVLVFSLINLPLSMYLLRNSAAIYLSPLVGSFFGLISAFVHLMVSLPISIVWLAVSVGINVAFVALNRTRAIVVQGLRAWWFDVGSRTRTGLVAIFAVVAWVTTPAPLGWDARSMWFAAGSWLQGPPIYYFEAMFLEMAGWRDYPLAGPASMATVWELSGITEHFVLGGRLMGILTVIGFALAAELVILSRGSNLNKYLSGGAYFLFLSSALFVADGMLNTGYMDTFQGAVLLGLAGVLVMLASNRESELRLVLVACVLAVLGSNIKQEGMWFALALVLPITLVMLAQKRPMVLIVSLAILLQRLMWGLFGDWVAMPSSASTASMLKNAPELFTGASQAWDGIRTTIDLYVMPQSSALVVLLVLGVAGILFSVEWSKSQRVLISSSLFVSGLGILFIVLMTYALGDVRDSLEWWLGTSYSRVTATFQGFAWFMAFSGFIFSLPEIRPARSAIKKTLKNKR